MKKTHTPHFAGICNIEGSNEKFVRMMELQSEFSSVDLAEVWREVRKWQPIPRPENRLPRPALRHPDNR